MERGRRWPLTRGTVGGHLERRKGRGMGGMVFVARAMVLMIGLVEKSGRLLLVVGRRPGGSVGDWRGERPFGPLGTGGAAFGGLVVESGSER